MSTSYRSVLGDAFDSCAQPCTAPSGTAIRAQMSLLLRLIRPPSWCGQQTEVIMTNALDIPVATVAASTRAAKKICYGAAVLKLKDDLRCLRETRLLPS